MSAGIGDDLAVGVDDHASARVGKFGIVPRAIDSDDIGLILDGAGLKQRYPMMLAHYRPAGDDTVKICTEADSAAEMFREAQVVADQRRDRKTFPREDDRRFAGRVVDRFAAKREG